MNCNIFERQIPAFLEDDLEMGDLEQFIAHAEECENCMEELTIQLLVHEGMQYLEDGDSFHLGNELGKKIKNAKAVIEIYEHLFIAASWLEVMSVCAFGVCIWCFIHLMGV